MIKMIDHITVIDTEHFNSNNYNQLKSIMKMTTTIIFANNFVMNEKQKDIFLNYNFESLTSLNLAGQNIDDNFVKRLCIDGNLEKIMRLDLRNTNVTYELLEYLLENEGVRCEGDKVAISGKYGRPIVNIEIIAHDTNIKNDKRFFTLTNFEHTFYSHFWNTAYDIIKEINVIC